MASKRFWYFGKISSIARRTRAASRSAGTSSITEVAIKLEAIEARFASDRMPQISADASAGSIRISAATGQPHASTCWWKACTSVPPAE
eukprot:scaffold10324_cov77-Phaeocystis_antarctica.AAC.3